MINNVAMPTPVLLAIFFEAGTALKLGRCLHCYFVVTAVANDNVAQGTLFATVKPMLKAACVAWSN